MSSSRAPLVDNAQVKFASLHNPLPLALHTYVWPFLIVWPVFFAFYLSEERYEKHFNGQEWTFVWSGSIVTIQSLFWLSTFWNINIRSLFTTTRASDVRSAGLIKVLPAENAGSADICPIERETVDGKTNISFLFQKRRFLYSQDTGSFAPLSYPLDQQVKPTIGEFQKSKGLTTAKEIARLQQY
ncbi:putative cation transporting ATPase, partial [Aureobasidium melanogenum]